MPGRPATAKLPPPHTQIAGASPQNEKMSRVKVFFTVDVEVWPGAWTDIDARFPEAFRRYVYGDTPHGQYGLPMKLRILNDHGLRGVFFVEPVFSARYGIGPLQEIVGLIREAGQEVQMHLHTEWVNEARTELLGRPLLQKMQHLSYFNRDDQVRLVQWSRERLIEAGAGVPTAFRAGSFMFNRDTLHALEANQIQYDSSYNHCCEGLRSGIREYAGQGAIPVVPFQVGGVVEAPVTVYRDLPFKLRPLQLTACSFGEMAAVLRNAAEASHPAVVIVSHNFELLDRRDFSRDETVTRRYVRLCEFLSRNSDTFESAGFHDGPLRPVERQPAPVSGSIPATAVRYAEQLKRRL